MSKAAPPLTTAEEVQWARRFLTPNGRWHSDNDRMHDLEMALRHVVNVLEALVKGEGR